MKAPVYFEPTLELLGVVDVDSVQLEMLRQGRCIRMAKMPPLPPFAPNSFDAIGEIAFEAIEFCYFPVCNSTGVETVILTVKKRDWLECWPKQLWPRRRKEWHHRRRRDKRRDVSSQRGMAP